MRNKNMVYTAVLAAVIAVLLSLFAVYAADETETSDVVFLDGSYTVTGEETSEQGMSAEFPFKVLRKPTVISRTVTAAL